ncbi:MAG: hypothetical protein IPG32_19080 [Saprospirales bacterium]|nr:hypothetical protein [Saprospirales bacterium]
METTPMHEEFARHFDPERVEARTFSYTTKVSNTSLWELEVRQDGLFYKDISPCYSQMKNQVYPQSFSDYWFYGPLMPLPDPETRKWLVDAIRRAFRGGGEALAGSHFPLFDYPKYANPPGWIDGDYLVSDFVYMRDYGLDYGAQNFHDGLVYIAFISFEYCLTKPEFAAKALGQEVWEDVKDRIYEECLPQDLKN